MAAERESLRTRGQLALDAALSREGGPLRSDGKWLRVAPFAVITAITLILALLPGTTPDGPPAHPQAVVAALGLAVLTLVLVAVVPWDSLPTGLQGVVPLVYTLSIMMLRHAEGSGEVGYIILYMLPVIWVALFSPGWQLAGMLVWVSVLIVLPPIVDGPLLGEEHYPDEDYRLSIIVILVMCLTAGLLRFGATAAAADPLTGLPNRRAFMASLTTRAALAARAGESLTVGLIDLDHFKRYNDANGHEAGDHLLRECAAGWRTHLRGRDMIGRVGGEEFGLLLDGPPDPGGPPVDRLIPAVPNGQTASIGLAVLAPGGDPVAALRAADAALYDAKGNGRARVSMAAAAA